MIGEKCISRSKLIVLHVDRKVYKQKYSKKTELSIKYRRVVFRFFLSALFVSSESILIESYSLI